MDDSSSIRSNDQGTIATGATSVAASSVRSVASSTTSRTGTVGSVGQRSVKSSDSTTTMDVTKSLLQTGPPRSAVLHRAGLDGHVHILKFLLEESRLSVNKKDEQDTTALHWASLFPRSVAAVAYLLEQPHVQVNLRDLPQGWTPLHYAASTGNTAAVQLLTQHPQLDINLKDWNGKSALHIASYQGHVEVVKVLLQSMLVLDVHARTAAGQTALDLADPHKKTQLTDVFQSFFKRREEYTRLQRKSTTAAAAAAAANANTMDHSANNKALAYEEQLHGSTRTLSSVHTALSSVTEELTFPPVSPTASTEEPVFQEPSDATEAVDNTRSSTTSVAAASLLRGYESTTGTYLLQNNNPDNDDDDDDSKNTPSWSSTTSQIQAIRDILPKSLWEPEPLVTAPTSPPQTTTTTTAAEDWFDLENLFLMNVKQLSIFMVLVVVLSVGLRFGQLALWRPHPTYPHGSRTTTSNNNQYPSPFPQRRGDSSPFFLDHSPVYSTLGQAPAAPGTTTSNTNAPPALASPNGGGLTDLHLFRQELQLVQLQVRQATLENQDREERYVSTLEQLARENEGLRENVRLLNQHMALLLEQQARSLRLHVAEHGKNSQPQPQQQPVSTEFDDSTSTSSSDRNEAV